jgi:broad specificity phosphatase PhoE
MSARVIFLTHAEVEIDPAVPVPEWGLSATGRQRHEAFAADERLDSVRAIYSSEERKAMEGAAAPAERLRLTPRRRADMGENDRSATGYLPPEEFWPVVDRFFAEPETSVLGWEPARAAQNRIVGAMHAAMAEAPEGDLLVVAHGGVGALLRCRLAGREITRDAGQPHPGGGCWFAFDRATMGNLTEWTAI